MHMYTAIVDGKEVSGYAGAFVVSYAPGKPVLVKCYERLSDPVPLEVYRMGPATEPGSTSYFICPRFELSADGSVVKNGCYVSGAERSNRETTFL